MRAEVTLRPAPLGGVSSEKGGTSSVMCKWGLYTLGAKQHLFHQVEAPEYDESQKSINESSIADVSFKEIFFFSVLSYRQEYHYRKNTLK